MGNRDMTSPEEGKPHMFDPPGHLFLLLPGCLIGQQVQVRS